MDIQTRREFEAIKIRLNDMDAKISNFSKMLSQLNRSDIDYIAMETGIELEQEDEDERA